MASTRALGTPQKEGGAEGSAGWQAIESSGVQYSDTSKSRSPTVRLQNDEVSSSGDELTTKVRKPYTITKQRERWTEEEHQKFLEALKMHGRAWRRIEEHIGTKTAVQIRSHAQKFFSKMEREASARGNAQDISIPPPRPKRKPSHPYPRKAGTTIQSASSANEAENRSPRAVSSASDRLSVHLNLDVTTRKNAAFTPYNAKPRPLQTKVNINMQEIKMDSSSSNSSPSSLKLFGKTVVVPTNESTLDGNGKGAFREFTSLKQETTTFEGNIADNPKLEDEKGSPPTITLKPQSKLKKAGIVFSNIPPTESGASALEGTGESNGNSPCLENHTGQQDSDEQLSSELDNNSNYLSRKHQDSTSTPVLGYPRHVPVQHVETPTTDNSNDSMKYRPNAASLAHDFAAMSMLSGNSSSTNTSGQMQNDVHNSLQPNILLPFPGMHGPFNRAFNNLENVRCVPGFLAPGSVPNGPLAPWPLTPSAALHHPAYAAATLAAAGFWPGLLSGTSGSMIGNTQPSSTGVNGHILCDETSAAAAVTAATVAAASAWWTLNGAIPPPFLHPGIYSPIVAAMAAEAAVAAAGAASGISSAVCKTEPLTDARKQEQVATTNIDNEILDEMHSIPHSKADRKLSMEQLDDGNECLPCPKSGSAEHFLQDSASCSDQNPTSCMEESCDAEMQIEKQNCKTEEKEHNTHYTNLHDGENKTNRKLMSSSGSNTPSSAEPETDTYLETNMEVIKGNDGDFESNGKGNRSSEAGVEDPLRKNIECSTFPETLDKAEREKNHLLANEEEITDDNRKHVHKDRHHSHGGDGGGRRCKSGCHLTDQWKAVSEEGRIAFQALFARDVLPQSFSPPQSIDGQEKTQKSTEASSCDNAKKKVITMSSNELQIDIENVLLNNSKIDDVNTQREEWCLQGTPSNIAASPAQEKKMQDFEATISDRSLEDYGYCGTSSSPNENASTDLKPSKSPAISSFGNLRSGRGFVPYQRCSMEVKKTRLHTRPTPTCQDDVREEKRICLEQEVKET